MHEWQGASGVTIRGDAWGDPDGRVVILQHGGGQTRHAWRGAGETLGDAGYYAIAMDSRGHGDSDWSEDASYEPEMNVQDLLAVVESIGAEQPILVGASMGGSTSLLAVGTGRLDAAALVLVDIAPRIEPEGSKKIKAFMDQKPDGFDSLEEVAAAIANYQPHRKRPRNLDGLAKNIRLGSDGRYHWHWDPRRRNRNWDMNEHRQHLEAAADNLDLPVLLVRGGLSDVLSEDGAQAFLTQCPHAEYVNVTGAAHMVAGDRNDVFSGSVVDFLHRVVPPR
ncbi:MAG: pimeloyl-ACP methyl ester carboxylesterase [Acidimicrobiales bacterium]|jgi:pimeloyl-ACP methyl ester carboxylesterase